MLHKAGILFQGRYPTPSIFCYAHKHIKQRHPSRPPHEPTSTTDELIVFVLQQLFGKPERKQNVVNVSNSPLHWIWSEYPNISLSFFRSHIPATNSV